MKISPDKYFVCVNFTNLVSSQKFSPHGVILGDKFDWVLGVKNLGYPILMKILPEKYFDAIR